MSNETTDTPTAASPTYSAAWTEAIAPFVKFLGLSAVEVTTKLHAAGLASVEGSESDAEFIKDPEGASKDDLEKAFKGSAPDTKIAFCLKKVRPEAAPVAATAAAANPARANPFFGSAAVLPDMPTDDGAFLGLLKTLQVGGVLEVDITDVLAATRGLLSSRIGIFGIEKTLLNAIRERSRELKKPHPKIYYDIQKSLARKAHADVLQALDVPSSVASQAAQTEFLSGMQQLFDHLAGFDSRLDEWRKQLQAEMMTNPAMMMGMFNPAAAAAGIGNMEDAAPDTAPLTDAASAIIDAINGMFAGDGVFVARAIAADAMQLQNVLTNPALLPAINCGTPEELCRKLNVNVGADTVRTAQSLAKYVWCVLKLPETPPTELPMYITSLKRLGGSIPWAALTSGSYRAPAVGTTRGGNGHSRDGRRPDFPTPHSPFGSEQR